jgi:hypothetical protein
MIKLKFTPQITTVIRKADGTIKEEHTQTGKAKVIETVVREEKPKKRTRRKKNGNGN